MDGYICYGERHIDYFPFVIDACSFIPLDRLPADIVDTLKEAVLTSDLRHKLQGRIGLCYLVAHCRPPGWQRILDEIKKTLPHTKNGRVSYQIHSGPRPSVIYNIRRVEELMRFSYPYSRAESQSAKRRLLAQVERTVDFVPCKAWLIYRYDPQYFRILLSRYERRDKLAVTANRPISYRRSLLSEVLKLHSLVPVDAISPDEIREFTYSQHSPTKTVNGLFLLENIVSEHDTEKLLALAKQTTILEWKREYGVKEVFRSEPLVALRAIECLAQISTPEGRQALEQVARNKDLPERVRKHAREKIKSD